MIDYAVVVGISRYPGLTTDKVVARDLRGPDRDAQDVYDWLVHPDGGGLAPDNVRLLRSVDPAPAGQPPEPTLERVQQQMDWLEQQTSTVQGGRLYLYFAGHGFAPALEEGALFTADATLRRPSHIHVHAWLRWFRRAQRFRETVLWMDCCMNDQRSIPAGAVGLRDEVGTGVPGPAFIALAAQTRSALEDTMPDGQVHGVFTWTLIKGLRGAAADERGRITGDSLRTFLYNVMPELLPAGVRASASVDLQPFVRADQGIEFGRLPAPPRFAVRLTVPPASAGQRLRLWADRPHTLVVEQLLNGLTWVGELERGLYVAELPGLRHGFQVTGAGPVEVAVSTAGPPVRDRPGARRFRLRVSADNPAATIIVTDYAFERIGKDVGELDMRDKSGVYKVRVELGRDISLLAEEVVLLDRDTRLHRATRPQLASPAPLTGSSYTHEYQRDPFYASRSNVFGALAAEKSAVSVLTRYWTAPDAVPDARLPHPMSGLRLLDTAGHVLADLRRHCQVDDRASGDPVAVWEQELTPGAYLLRQMLGDGRRVDGSVLACRGFVTQIAIQRLAAVPSGAGSPPVAGSVGDIAVFMRAPGDPPGPSDQDAVIETARLALTEGRDLFAGGGAAPLRELLLGTYRDPIAGILGCHLLLRTMTGGGPAADGQRFDDAVRRLRSMVGTEHPDVEALSLRCTDPLLRTGRPFTRAPMFADGWQLIVEASYGRPDLVSAELGRRVRATIRVGPFLAWAADRDTRQAHATLVSEWIDRYGTADGAGRRPRVPMAVADRQGPDRQGPDRQAP